MHRRGFTIVELLVSLAIIAFIIAMIAPAVQSSRETARRLECLNRLKQYGIALSSFESTYRRFPGIDSEAPVQPAALSFGPRSFEHNASWLSVHAQLLGHLEQGTTAKKIDRAEMQPSGYTPPSSVLNASLLETDLPVFKCPSDAVPRGGNSYRVSVANHTYPIVVRGSPDAAFPWNWGYVSEDAQPLFVGWRTDHFLDGLSHTAFASERIVGDGDDGTYQSARDVAIRAMASVPEEPPDAVASACDFGVSSMSGHVSHLGWTWLYAGFGHTQYNHVLSPNSRKPDVGVKNGLLSIYYGAISARSFHKGGVNLLLGDGGAKFVADSIDLKIWRALATIAGNEVVSDL